MRFNAYQLKLFAMALMLLDHIHAFIPGSPDWFHWLGRIAAPIFFFFLVEGFVYTRSREKYMLRMLIFTIIMAAGSDALVLLLPGGSIPNNIFLSMLAALMLMATLDWMRQSRQYVTGLSLNVLLSLVMVFYVEFSWLAVSMTLVFYIFRGRTAALVIGYVISSLLLTLGPYALMPDAATKWTYDELFILHPQWMMIAAVVPILLYNGSRGSSSKRTKYMFYLFYPIHIWLLYVVGNIDFDRGSL
ncbi:conjugal transfer protein TraX [Paenibacillus sp. MER TA 81-3]|uniref:TraX family protein n=1 Tax=Paenibacillus sp. MER TA 81-3 TaxID=2939573 RepID=UPI00203CB4DE|nr:TraX family protein [Paenibacillus sp. MER TA 81-3]MCM3341934.1 conjugal transfer protein TraX [Paenibacillus sp. MER TA 81-3]